MLFECYSIKSFHNHQVAIEFNQGRTIMNEDKGAWGTSKKVKAQGQQYFGLP